MAKTKQEKPLNKAAADALVGELKEGLANLIEDEDSVAAIIEKWDARNLAGKTRTQILGGLFADVKSVIEDKETQDSIWEGWQEVGLNEEDEDDPEDPKPAAQPAKPVTPPVKPAVQPNPPADPDPVIRPMQGQIWGLNPAKNMGYINATDGNRYYFHFSALGDVDGKSLADGMQVSFEIKQTKSGVIVMNVRLI